MSYNRFLGPWNLFMPPRYNKRKVEEIAAKDAEIIFKEKDRWGIPYHNLHYFDAKGELCQVMVPMIPIAPNKWNSKVKKLGQRSHLQADDYRKYGEVGERCLALEKKWITFKSNLERRFLRQGVRTHYQLPITNNTDNETYFPGSNTWYQEKFVNSLTELMSLPKKMRPFELQELIDARIALWKALLGGYLKEANLAIIRVVHKNLEVVRETLAKMKEYNKALKEAKEKFKAIPVIDSIIKNELTIKDYLKNADQKYWDTITVRFLNEFFANIKKFDDLDGKIQVKVLSDAWYIFAALSGTYFASGMSKQFAELYTEGCGGYFSYSFREKFEYEAKRFIHYMATGSCKIKKNEVFFKIMDNDTKYLSKQEEIQKHNEILTPVLVLLKDLIKKFGPNFKRAYNKVAEVNGEITVESIPYICETTILDEDILFPIILKNGITSQRFELRFNTITAKVVGKPRQWFRFNPSAYRDFAYLSAEEQKLDFMEAQVYMEETSERNLFKMKSEFAF